MRALITILIVLLSFSSVHAEGLTAWIYSGVDYDNKGNEVAARIGYVKGAIELGGLSQWYPSDKPPQVFGIYGLYLFEDAITIPQILPLSWLPETLTATPYIGGQVTVDFAFPDTDGTMVGPIAGVEIQGIIVVEYQYRNYSDKLGDYLDNEHRVMFGIRHAF